MSFLEITSKAEMNHYLPQVWDLLVLAYCHVPGGLHYANPGEVVYKTDVWHLVIEESHIVAITLHKKKHGLKLVAMAKTRDGRGAFIDLIKHALRFGWMELSDKAEQFVISTCDGHRFIINGSYAHKLLGKIVWPSQHDTFHYRRKIMSQFKTKLLLGTPDFSFVA
jgi:hypothetical protein